jgi:cullin 3
MVSKFKLECGSVLTHKMETMFSDLIRSNQES